MGCRLIRRVACMDGYVVAVTGASGSIYALSLLDFLLGKNIFTHLVVSEPAQVVAKQELGCTWEVLLENNYSGAIRRGLLRVWGINDFSAPVASGSFKSQGMIIIPTSMSTLAGIAQGISGNLIQRAADVMLKEKRPLILVPRETPLSPIHLKNMLALCEIGAYLVPPIPAFYHNPQTVQDIINFGVGRILDILGIEHELYRPWGSEPEKLVSLGGIINV